DAIPPEQIGCIFSQYFDSTGAPTHRLMEANGVVRVQEPPDVPVINSFEANPDTIGTGGSATLSWNVSNATTVSINQGIGTVDSIGQTTVYPSATTTYTLTATNADGSVIATAKVTVVEAPPNNKPVFNTPAQTFWSIEQGQTLAFSVNVTDADNDNLTLTATNLPSNSTFGPTNPVIGVGSVTGNFSFTPDFTQVGQFNVTFTANDGQIGGTQTLIVTIEVTEIQYDRLFTTSAEDQKPCGGLPGAGEVLIPINLVTSQEVYGVQFDFIYDDQYFVLDSIITTPRTPNFVIYENIGQTAGQVRVVTFGVANEPIESDTNTTILYMVMSIDSLAPPGNYPIVIDSGWESVNPDPDFPSLPLQTDGGIIQVDLLGDVNLDQRVDVADAVNVVGYILGNFGLNPRQFDAADVVRDSSINVLDLVAIINIIFGIPPSPVSGLFVSNEMARVSLLYPDMPSGGQELLTVRSELPEQIAGVQLELRYDPSTIDLGKPSLGADATHMVLSSRDNENGKLTVLLYFKNPYRTHELIQPGEAELVRVPIYTLADLKYGDEARLRLSDAMLSTPEAQAVRVEGIDPELPTTFILQQNYPNPFNPTTTIEFSLGYASDGSLTQHVKLDIFNILGQRVKTLVDDKLTPGNYQVEWDATNSGGRKVASGIYLYRLQVDRESESKKMMLLK
ncbi:MAG: FlgD immunoglobulin-like domain containing protein, partial [Candidatus Zixiibacteriota bacterium]